jgi:ligand-binding SRPBCC domain-containing protein
MRDKSVSDTIHINAPHEVVWDAISDLSRMGRFSLENTGGKWLPPHHGPEIGACFRGTNRHGSASWTTMATVTACDVPERFAFKVTYFAIPISTWTYELRAEGDGVSLTESWTDQRPRWFTVLSSPIRSDRSGFTKKSIRHTLEAVATWAQTQQ